MRTCGSPEELERQRFRAIVLLAAGHRPCDVADMLGVSRGSVSDWKKACQRDGPEGLKAKRHHGPKPKLTSKRQDKLARLPPYAPDLNLVEAVWQHSTHADLANFLPTDVEDLDWQIRVSLHGLRRKQTLLHSFFKRARLKV